MNQKCRSKITIHGILFQQQHSTVPILYSHYLLCFGRDDEKIAQLNRNFVWTVCCRPAAFGIEFGFFLQEKNGTGFNSRPPVAKIDDSGQSAKFRCTREKCKTIFALSCNIDSAVCVKQAANGQSFPIQHASQLSAVILRVCKYAAACFWSVLGGSESPSPPPCFGQLSGGVSSNRNRCFWHYGLWPNFGKRTTNVLVSSPLQRPPP